MWLAVAALAVLAAALQIYRVADPIRGFHAFNEGFYLLNGIKDSSRSLLAPVVSPLDANNPWFYPLLLSVALRVFGQTIAIARMLSIVASAASVLLTFAIGTRLYNEKVGLMAAAFFAFAPVQIIVGRNIQTDAVMLALVLGAIYCFLRSVETEKVSWAVITGVLIALGTFTKLPAILVVPAFAIWQTWREHGFGWVKLKSTWVAASAFTVAVLPWYAYRAVSSTQFTGAQRTLFATGGWRGLKYLYADVLTQWFWMLTPILAAAAVAAIVWLAVRRESADKLILSLLMVYSAFFVFYNYHSYYYYPLAPFAAIAAARGADSLFATTPRRVAAVVVLSVALLYAIHAARAERQEVQPGAHRRICGRHSSGWVRPARGSAACPSNDGGRGWPRGRAGRKTVGNLRSRRNHEPSPVSPRGQAAGAPFRTPQTERSAAIPGSDSSHEESSHRLRLLGSGGAFAVQLLRAELAFVCAGRAAVALRVG